MAQHAVNRWLIIILQHIHMKWRLCSLTCENIHKSCDKLTGWSPASEEWAGLGKTERSSGLNCERWIMMEYCWQQQLKIRDTFMIPITAASLLNSRQFNEQRAGFRSFNKTTETLIVLLGPFGQVFWGILQSYASKANWDTGWQDTVNSPPSRPQHCIHTVFCCVFYLAYYYLLYSFIPTQNLKMVIKEWSLLINYLNH